MFDKLCESCCYPCPDHNPKVGVWPLEMQGQEQYYRHFARTLAALEMAWIPLQSLPDIDRCCSGSENKKSRTSKRSILVWMVKCLKYFYTEWSLYFTKVLSEPLLQMTDVHCSYRLFWKIYSEHWGMTAELNIKIQRSQVNVTMINVKAVCVLLTSWSIIPSVGGSILFHSSRSDVVHFGLATRNSNSPINFILCRTWNKAMFHSRI